MFVEEVSGGTEGDNEPAHHHRDRSRQVHGLEVEQDELQNVSLSHFLKFYLPSL